ncbi:MAG: TauD/TfdA family dioxygenase [Pyrinomonadaceae bacterium]
MMSQRPDMKALIANRRREVTLSPEQLVMTESLPGGGPLPLVVRPAVKDVNLADWAAVNREFIASQLLAHGACLFRGFNLRSVTEFERLIKAVSGRLLEYTYRSTPRSPVSGNIYTSTEYPAEHSIPLHNEMSYARDWPLKIWFFCRKTAATGGETPIADSGKVFNRIAPEIREQFAAKGVMYVRNYGRGVDLPWQQVFNTESRQAVEDFCRSAGIEFEWSGGDRLRTRQRCQGVAAHPLTGRSVWFNQAHLFHVSSLERGVRDSLLKEFGEENLPRNAFYGDGSPIEPSALEQVRQAYHLEEIIFPWQEQDILLLDNMRVAHGRTPYAGPRSVVVGMAEPSAGRDA